MSMIENLKMIAEKWIRFFWKNQYQKHHCEVCGSMISVHKGKCFHCDPITRLIEKYTDDKDK